MPDTFKKRRGETLIGRDMIVFEHDPQAGAIAFFLGANGAGELSDFHGMRRFGSEFEIGEVAGFLGDGFVMLAENFEEHAAGVVNQVAKTLRDEHAVDIARSGVFQINKVVIRERFLERYFDGDRWLVGVRNNLQWHNKVLHYAGHLG